MFAIWKKMMSMAQAYITIKKTWCKQSLGSSLWTSFLLCVTMWKCFRTASSPSAALPRAHQTWSSSGTGGGELGFPSTWSNLIRYFDLCWRFDLCWCIAMIRDNCLVNISVADRFMKEAVYHTQVDYNVRTIVSMIIRLVQWRQNRIFMLFKIMITSPLLPIEWLC